MGRTGYNCCAIGRLPAWSTAWRPVDQALSIEAEMPIELDVLRHEQAATCDASQARRLASPSLSNVLQTNPG